MSNLDDYNTKLEVIKAIPDDQIKNPNSIPVEIYIQEAEMLLAWCQVDKDSLTASGLDWTVVEDLPIRCGALRQAEAQWQIEQELRRNAEKIWVRECPKGYAFRDELIHHFNYAFRDKSSLIKKVKEIANRSTHDGMIDGLYDLNILGMIHQYLLEKIGFDFKLLDMAVKKSRELARNKKAASFYSEDYLEVKKIRDQAYTHLKEAVDMIYDCGKFVFCENSARLKGYSSNHLRMKKMRWKRIHNVTGP
jgi:hypothetical protein